MLIVNRFAKQQQFPLLGAEQNDQPHHDGEASLVKLRGRNVLQELAITVKVGPIQRLHQHFNSTTDLFTERIGDFVLMFERAEKKRIEI